MNGERGTKAAKLEIFKPCATKGLGRILLLGLVLSNGVFLSSCSDPAESLQEKYSLGTAYASLKTEQAENSTFFGYISYAFWQEDGCDLAVHLDHDTHAVDEILVQKSHRASAKTFLSLEKSTELLDVVKQTGNPYGPAALGMILLGFRTDKGETVFASFSEDIPYLYFQGADVLP